MGALGLPARTARCRVGGGVPAAGEGVHWAGRRIKGETLGRPAQVI